MLKQCAALQRTLNVWQQSKKPEITNSSFIVTVYFLQENPSNRELLVWIKQRNTSSTRNTSHMFFWQCVVHNLRCFRSTYIADIKVQGEAVPVEASHRSTGFQEVKAPRQSAHEDGQVVRSTHQSPLPHRKYSWYSFLLEAESTSGP
jgi:hypothetical protein